MDIDYSPTGREFVTGSYDRTVCLLLITYNDFILSMYLLFLFSNVYIILLQVRIFNYLGDHSREIYHTKRMQRFFFVPTVFVSPHFFFLVTVGTLIFRPKSILGSLYLTSIAALFSLRLINPQNLYDVKLTGLVCVRSWSML
jgi:hypothetical protein